MENINKIKYCRFVYRFFLGLGLLGIADILTRPLIEDSEIIGGAIAIAPAYLLRYVLSIDAMVSVLMVWNLLLELAVVWLVISGIIFLILRKYENI